ncbi:MAG: glycosyltransferase family 39 protein [Candidatus Blackburnbacteria bacterium]|nr:glycosyltransferase family 39 protein [Candidatus Blackburnbacteria bacterium]
MKKTIVYSGFVLFFALTAIVYGALLSRTPVYLNQDELGFALNAYSIAQTGFDDNNRFFPLYFWHLGVMWATPIIVYATALVLRFLPLTEGMIRLPSVFVGLLDIFLVWILAGKIFKEKIYVFLAGFLLATTPVHFIHSRILLDNLFVIPFVILWLILLSLFIKEGRIVDLGLGFFVLGVGVHSYHAAKIMMPLYIFLTIWVLWSQVKNNKKLLGVVLVSFLLPLLPFIPWLSKYPDTLIDQVKYTQLYDAKLNPLVGVLSLLTPRSLLHRVDVYVNYFNPKFLFLRGDASLIHSTQKTGVLLFPLAIFVPLGIFSALRKWEPLEKILVAGFFTAPIAATIAGDHYRISRALFILPFAVILATYGVKFLFSLRSRKCQVLGLVLLFAIPLQGFYFLYDYFTDYRLRSYSWFNNNVPGALESIIKYDRQQSLVHVYFDKTIDFLPSYWKFYLIKHDRRDLLWKTEFFDPKFVDTELLPQNTLLLYSHHNVDGQKQSIGQFNKLDPIFEPDGVQKLYLYKN